MNNSQIITLSSVTYLQPGSVELPGVDYSKVRKFIVNNVIMLDTVFMEFLTNLSSVESLEFSNFQIVSIAQNLCPNVRILCSFLRNISFELSSWSLFEFIYAPCITSLRLVSQNLYAHPSIMTFLSELNELRCFELHAVSCDIMEFFSFSNCCFTLKQLVLMTSEYYKEPTTKNDEEFLDFIKEHAVSLNSLEMRALVSPACLDFLTKKLRCLRWIMLKANCLIPDTQIYSNKKPRKSVKSLILEGPFNGLNMIVPVLNLYPTIKLLQLKDVSVYFELECLSEILRNASKICTEIKDLHLSRMPTVSNEGLIFGKLETLRIGYLNDWNDLISFLRNNKRVHTVIIEFLFRFQTDIRYLEMLLKSSVKNLHVTGDATEIKRIHEFIDTIGNGNIQFLELTINSTGKTYSFHYSPGNTNSLKSAELLEDVNFILIDETADYLDDGEESELGKIARHCSFRCY